MSIVWQKTSGQDHFEVRRAGNSIRLYRNGVLHTQYNPRHPIGGNLWDLFLIPAFFSDPATIRRVLVLGVGGGAVIRLLNRFVEPEEIIGVELNPVHIQAARRFFGIGRKQATLVQADAAEWLRNYRGPPFDLIVDDVFGEQAGEPARAVAADAGWFTQLTGRLSPGGILVMNFATRAELKGCAWFHDPAVQARFKAAFQLTKPQYENTVAVFLTEHATSGQLRQNLARTPGLDPGKKSTRISYRIRSI